MHVIVAGCGRVGSGLAESLTADGHEVAIIDRDAQAFRRLSPGFTGTTLLGLVFDRSTLLRAGIDRADAFVAVTNGDNSNVVSARTAKEHFGVAAVVARIYDPERAEIYERHGITTIATARWTADAILTHLMADDARVETTIGPGEGDVVIVSHDLPASGGPWEAEVFARQGRWLLAAVTRTGQTTIPVPRQLVQAGERVHLAVQRTSLEEVEVFLASLTQPEGAEAPAPVGHGRRKGA
ncbi:MAG TPA: TrkA family potassium uptake protein [Euzebya sp.]|nr:TrkA family potassium uptake protein [Euzebya sp.]